MEPTGLEAVFLAHRAALLGFLRAQGATEDAEDLLHELWLRVRTAPTAPIAAPLAYLYRAANNLMLDRYRAARQASARDSAWTDLAQLDHAPGAERLVMAREEIAAVGEALAKLPPRAAAIFRRHRIDGVAQRVIAAEWGVSLSTVEGDLRLAYAAVLAVRRRFDEA